MKASPSAGRLRMSIRNSHGLMQARLGKYDGHRNLGRGRTTNWYTTRAMAARVYSLLHVARRHGRGGRPFQSPGRVVTNGMSQYSRTTKINANCRDCGGHSPRGGLPGRPLGWGGACQGTLDPGALNGRPVTARRGKTVVGDFIRGTGRRGLGEVQPSSQPGVLGSATWPKRCPAYCN